MRLIVPCLIMMLMALSLPLHAQSESETIVSAPGLRLPSSFEGVLPCADCPGIAHHLDLWPDQTFQLRREWLERDVRDDFGRWHVDPSRRALVLDTRAEMPLQFEILGNGQLRQLDLEGRPINSDLPYELTALGRLEPIEPSTRFSGMFIYYADAALFTECTTGARFPIAMEADYLQAEQAYLEGIKEPATELFVLFEGRIALREPMEGDAPVRTIVIDQFDRTEPSQACEQTRRAPMLTNTFWRLETLADEALEPLPGGREPYLLLLPEDDRYSATAGCNQMGGGFSLDGDQLTFGQAMSTLMACPPPLDAYERALADVLDTTATYTLDEMALTLLDEQEQPLAELRAVYTP